MKKTRGDKTKKRQTKNKKIKGGSKSTTRKSPNAISKNEKKKLKMLAIIYADVINELVFCTYDAFDKIENAKLTEEERNFYKTFINCAVNNVFKRLYEIGMISKKDIKNLIETVRMYINTKYVGGARSFGNNTTITGTIMIFVIIIISIYLNSIYNSNVASNSNNNSKLIANDETSAITVGKIFAPVNNFFGKIKTNKELEKYSTNYFKSCFMTSFFYKMSMTQMSNAEKNKFLELFKHYFRGAFTQNPAKVSYLPNIFKKQLLGGEYDNRQYLGVAMNGFHLNEITMQIEQIINELVTTLGMQSIPPSKDPDNIINEFLKADIDKSLIFSGGNSTLRIVMEDTHVYLLLTYYIIDKNNEVVVSNCVVDPSHMIEPFNINGDGNFKMYCGENFPFPQETFSNANIIVSETPISTYMSMRGFSRNSTIRDIERWNPGRTDLNPQPNITESMEYLKLFTNDILEALKEQTQLLKLFGLNQDNPELKRLFLDSHNQLELLLNAASAVYFGNKFIKPYNSWVNTPPRSEYKLPKENELEKLYLNNELHKLDSSRKKMNNFT